MDQRRWTRLWEIFEAAIDRTPEARAACLDEACGADAHLRDEVESLLAAHDRAGDFIEQAAGEEAVRTLAEDQPPAPPGPAPGDRVGPYEVVRALGHGGMGSVHLAFRADDQYRHQVAIKVIRAGLDNPDLLQRFLDERQILANLSHPNIARLLDGGSLGAGAPYVVMEYVEGEPIDLYCRRAGLDLRQRLLLFQQICSAVQYAHRNLIVHRDLKPGNILVGQDGVPKLLDFGIAKVLAPDASGAGAHETHTAMRRLTPEYASPEQVRGDNITTAADVYSLGVLLYQLLTGMLPYQLGTGWPADLERAICETVPERPSTAVTRQGSTAPRPGVLRRQLRGDLDNIILMALRKEPERRYQSVDLLSQDIQRHLEGRPVQARGDAWSYRVAKFVRRNPWGVAAAAAITVLLLGLGLSMAVQSVRVSRQRDRALAAEVLAGTEARSAAQVSRFLVDLFGGVSPEEARGREVTAREILDRGALRIRHELRDQPEIQGRLKSTMGEVYGKLGLYDEAVALLEDALRQRISLAGEDDPETGDIRAQLGTLYQTRGDFDAAEKQIVKAVELKRKLLAPDDPAGIDTMKRLGHLRHAQGRYDEAREAFEAALRIARAAHGDRHEATAGCLQSLAQVMHSQGHYADAEKLFREALAIQMERLGGDHPEVSSTLNNLGALLEHMTRYEEAEEALTRSLETCRRIYGEKHVQVATALNNLAALLKQKGDPAAAEKHQREALALYQELLGEDNYHVAMSYNNIANLLHDQGDYDAAEAMHRKSLAHHRKVLGESHPLIGDVLNNLANLLWDKGDYDAAEPLYREALGRDRSMLGPDHPYVAMDINNLALVLRDRGDLAGALPLVEQAIEVSSRAQGRENPTTALYIASLAALYLRMNRLPEAESRIDEALRIQRAALTQDHWRIHQSRSIRGEILAARGRSEEAERLLLESHEALQRQLGPRSGFTRRAREAIARFFRASGRIREAAVYESSL
jgi:serine/threonine-protein kinase